MNVLLDALNNEIKKNEKEIKEREYILEKLRSKHYEEAKIEQERLIKLFNQNKCQKLHMINSKLPKGHTLSGFESNTYYDDKLTITISNGQYIFDFVIEDGIVVYKGRSRNDGVSTNCVKEIISIINTVLNSN